MTSRDFEGLVELLPHLNQQVEGPIPETPGPTPEPAGRRRSGRGDGRRVGRRGRGRTRSRGAQAPSASSLSPTIQGVGRLGAEDCLGRRGTCGIGFDDTDFERQRVRADQIGGALRAREDLTEIEADVADADRNTLSGKAFQNGNSVRVGNPRIRFQHTLVQRFGVTGHRQTGCPQASTRLAVQLRVEILLRQAFRSSSVISTVSPTGWVRRRISSAWWSR